MFLRIFRCTASLFSSKRLRDLIAKMGENSPASFWPDFLFISLTYATYLGVLETVQSLAMGSKLGRHKNDFPSKPENRGNDPPRQNVFWLHGLEV